MTFVPHILQFGPGDNPPAASLFYGHHVLEVLRTLPSKSVHCVCTSPPYYNLRDYKVDPQSWPEIRYRPMGGLPELAIPSMEIALGLEDTPEAYIGHMVEVFREVWRVLRDDGVCWVNLGDSYVSTAPGTMGDPCWIASQDTTAAATARQKFRPAAPQGLKPKDLTGIPWRFAFAAQADGWYLRSDIIWAKNSTMPESVRDRCTKAHEYVFLLTKNQTYFYDQDAIREPLSKGLQPTYSRPHKEQMAQGPMSRGQEGFNHQWADPDRLWGNPAGRNKRSVWTVNPLPFPGAHFACWPPDLVEPMILSGSSESCCPTCGAPFVRQVERETYRDIASTRDMSKTPLNVVRAGWRKDEPKMATLGWEPSCTCVGAQGNTRCVVLDPFSGSGTTGAVAVRLGRDYLGIDLNEGYRPLAEARILGETPERPDVVSQENAVLDMFAETPLP